MMKFQAILIAFVSLAISATAFSHSGRTDSNGGHNCSEKSKKKGLCSGYHYHANETIDLDTPVAKVQTKNSIEAESKEATKVQLHKVAAR